MVDSIEFKIQFHSSIAISPDLKACRHDLRHFYNILSIDEIANTNSKVEGMEVIKNTVLNLNYLNENADGATIEPVNANESQK